MTVFMKTTICLIITTLVSFSWVAFADEVRTTISGDVSGLSASYQTTSYLGIPYAAPPVGDLRWKAPRPPSPWSGVLNAHQMKPACMQKGNFFANVSADKFGLPVGDEDCLYLNVWTPPAASYRRPVVVWIHGGSNFKGTARDPMYDGAYMAAQDDVVFVSLNYRLGLLGAFTHPAFQKVGSKGDRSGNFTTLDLIQGLEWVQKNIAQFGGDPNNVTIMGHSAGCMNVWGLLQSPLAKGLYHKAVCSAGLPNAYPKIMAEERSKDFMAQLIVNAGLASDKQAAHCFLAKQTDTWIRKFMAERSAAEIVEAQDYSVAFQHISDGYVLPNGLEGVVFGDYNKVPMIMGSTDDEATYLLGATMLKPTDKELWQMIQNPGGRDLTVNDLVKSSYTEFKAATFTGSQSLWLTLHNGYLWLSLTHKDLYYYTFKWHETPSPWREVFGAIHGMDAIFYLGNFVTQEPTFSRFAWAAENKDSRERLREEMSRYFKGFFWQGDPNAYILKTDHRWDHSIDFK
jgi:para-nitrobenzyl esterase